MNKSSSTESPLFFVIDPKFLVLSRDESNLLHEMESIGCQLQAEATFQTDAELKERWGAFEGAVLSRNCPIAMGELQKYGSEESFLRLSHISETGRHAAYHARYAKDFLLVRPICDRIKATAEEALDTYRKSTAAPRSVLGLPAIVSDDATAILHDLIQAVVRVREMEPAKFFPPVSAYLSNWIKPNVEA